MTLEFFQTLWFLLIAVLFTGFLFLEGFDFGVGVLLPFVAKDDSERRLAINTIGPVWDGNEVWLLTAGGAMFAAFPNWYATLFSGFYLALFLILVALIIRGVAFEFRSKDRSPGWRTLWDACIFVGSLLPALLWGVAFGNILRGVPIDQNMNYVGTFGDLLNPFSLLTGVVTLLLFIVHGATYLELKSDGSVRQRAQRFARTLIIPTILLIVLWVIFALYETAFLANLNLINVAALLIAVVALLYTAFSIFRGRYGHAFVGTSVTIVSVTALIFATLFPTVLPSTLGYPLTIYNASSTLYTLRIMTIIALTLVPLVLAYQGWTYWVFRKRLTLEGHMEY